MEPTTILISKQTYKNQKIHTYIDIKTCKFCSNFTKKQFEYTNECLIEAKRNIDNGIFPKMERKKKTKDKKYKYQYYYDGYSYIHKPNHPFKHRNGYILEHRLMMEEYLREYNPDHPALINIKGDIKGLKYLDPRYDVHHWNGNRKDNRSINLTAVEKNKHRTLEKTSELIHYMERNNISTSELFKK